MSTKASLVIRFRIRNKVRSLNSKRFQGEKMIVLNNSDKRSNNLNFLLGKDAINMKDLSYRHFIKVFKHKSKVFFYKPYINLEHNDIILFPMSGCRFYACQTNFTKEIIIKNG